MFYYLHISAKSVCGYAVAFVTVCIDFQQIVMVMCSRLLRKVPMFQNKDENFISAILLKLEYEVFQEGDVIVRQYVPGDRMFFIDHGEVVMETDSYEREMCDGDYFGGGSDSFYSISDYNEKKMFSSSD